MSDKKPKPHPQPESEPDLDDYGTTYTIGKVLIPKLVSQAIDGFMTANDLKYLWDPTPRFRLIQYIEEEYIDDYED